MTFRVWECLLGFEGCRAWNLSMMSDTSVSILMCLFLSCMCLYDFLPLPGNAPANRFEKCRSVSLGRFAQGLVYRQPMPCGRTLSAEASCFSGKAGNLLADTETSLICQRRFFPDFERIRANQAVKWTVFLRITLPSPFTEANRSSKLGCSSKTNRFGFLPDMPGFQGRFGGYSIAV